MPLSIFITARHLVKRAPRVKYSVSRAVSPSNPSVTFSPGKFSRSTVPLSTLMPGIIPSFERSSGNGTPSYVFCRIVSSYKITPLRPLATSGEVTKSSRQFLRVSSSCGMPSAAKRLFAVPVLSSAAKIPFPGASIRAAISSSDFLSIV